MSSKSSKPATGSDPAQGKRGPIATAAVHILFAALMYLAVMVALGGVNSIRHAPTEKSITAGVVALAVGGVFACVIGAIWYLLFFIEPRRQAYAARMAGLHPGEPWMQNEMWAKRTVTDRANFGLTIFLWLWSLGWCAGLWLIWNANGHRILASARDSWIETLIAPLFPVLGLLGILAAIGATRIWFRYGPSTLRIDTLPGYMGETFRGVVSVRMPEPVSLEIELACERLSYSKSIDGKGLSRKIWKTTTVWSHTARIEAGDLMLARKGVVSIPIAVRLPRGYTPSGLGADGTGVQWVLYVRDVRRADVDGSRRYTAQFPIPVFDRKRNR
ncbi:hypothetical protein [Hyphomicrobium sulfonivorans]|uniref:hypothetical protein n=1 Tax=Hyphomicrobium sulfonivorans TaxID=121290 RepID=UPI00156F1256|nr:hypothetical protein [Hyphomicrobium sulfonivorans]MBI1651213.1 hypothetical protein [Hyphomicrobium sulfonivorans]NSL73179.1 hypothetical protein [Hyphomicrobium sulfonivorans]